MSRSNRRSLAHAITDALGLSSRRRDAWAHVALALVASVSTIEVDAAELPVPCVAGTCGSFFTSGHATTAVVGNTLNVNQTTNNATLNWSQFNISADGVVNFQQPSESATAINRIYQNDPSRIFGALNANGRVYLLNRNGVLFGKGAKVNVAGLVASSLDITEDALKNGIAGAAALGSPAFDAYVENGQTLASGDVRLEQGATISTADGGQVLIFAPNIVNEGNISTPGGQTLLAAGSPVYLITSPDKDLRGLLVEVGVGGTVTNGNAAMNEGNVDPTKLVGQIVAERGNVTLAGLAVNQTGRVSATTTVREGGSIRLQARDGGSVDAVVTPPQLGASNGGWLTLGASSVTEVTLADDPDDTTVDANEQPRSRIQLQGRDVMVLEDSRITATGGDIAITALANPGVSTAALTPPAIEGTKNDGSRIYIADGATLDVSGASVELDMEHNVVRAELRGDELADSPIQRDGALRGEAVFVDVRQHGTRADGTSWQGTPIGDVSGQISLVNRDVKERNLNGGTVSLASQGDVIVASGSTIDLSGGVATYRDGFINTTQLLGQDGRVYDIANADPNLVYVGTTSVYTVQYERWGETEKFRTFGDSGRFEQGYVEGRDAGKLSILSPRSILDGDLVANVTIGRYQRQAATELAAGATRPYDQLPLGAALILGRERETNSNDRVTGSVLFDEGLVLPGLRDPSVDPFDPEQDVLPLGFTTTRLRPELFGENRIARVEIHANERVEVSENVSLQLPGQGELSIDAGQLRIDGQIHAAGGKIDLVAQDTELTHTPDISFDVGSTAVFDVSGQWVNDSWQFTESGEQLAALLIDGGEVALSAEDSSLNLAAGSSIDVSAGAWLQSDGTVVAGKGGSIELSASRDLFQMPTAVSLNLGASLLGYALEQGGSLTLSAPEICVSSAGSCGEEASEGLLTLRPDDLMADGFGDVSLISNERGLTVAAGTDFQLRQRNYVLGENARNAASGTSMDEIASRAVLPDQLRTAANLDLRVAVPARSDRNPYTNELFDGVGRLEVQTGASISADAGASISLRSNTQILVDGTIDARAGTIELRLDNTLPIAETIANQAIWLGANARLDVSGTTTLEPDVLGFRRGEVFDGGTVRLLAERGSVIANPGSQIDISGTSSTLDISSPGSSATEAVATLIVSDGGLLDISASDGILLNSDIDAHAGEGSDSALGGELRFKLDASLRDFSTSLDERRIVVSQRASPIAVASDAVPAWLAGEGRIAAEQIDAAGFDTVRLNARTTEGTNGANERLIATGVIEFDGDVNLIADRSLTLEAARITGTGDVDITAPYVALGQSDVIYQDSVTTGAAEDGRLAVSGDFIELLGHSVIDGFDAVLFSSEGDLRLRGVLQNGQSVVAGGLSTSADLTLRADQVYGSTLTDFTLTVANNPEGVLRIESTGQERATVLSAASHLSLNAPTIEQAGVLRAPFGTIELNADQVNLQAGSITSTSAEGAIIPFGTTQAEKDWIYSLAANTRLVVGDTTAVPQQNVSLNGERVAIDEGAVIDVSGGGDLMTYEFMPGVTGTRDVLSALEEPGQFAIVPSLNIEQAPYDPQESAGTTLQVGDSVHLSGNVAGLPAGDYVLLPARYALLEGAYLIKAANGHADLRDGTTIAQLNGSTIVSGRHIVANTSFADAHTSGFEVRPGSAIAELARYETKLASDLLVAQAEANGTALPRLSQDAGVLAITAGAQLDINGSLRADAVEDGRGAAVDISAAHLRISEGEAGEGEVVVSADSLTRLGAESLLLGGRRSSSSDGTTIDVSAQSVTIDAGTALSAPEIVLAAADTVTVQSNATLTATGEVSTADTYLVDGDSAVLRLAAGDQAEIRRGNETGAAGTLILEEGARLTAIDGALALDASLDTRSDATLALTGGSLSLGASRINLGAAPEGVSGLTLSDAQLSGLSLDELVLVSRSTIDLYGAVALGVDDVSLDAAGIRGVAGGGGSITAANSLLLTNRANRTADGAGSSSGTLALNAAEIVVGEGKQTISGYDLVSLDASRGVRGEDDGGLNVAGDLTIVTPVMVAATAAETTIKADGALRVRSPVDTVAGTQGAELGGRFELTGTTVDIATRLEAAAGSVSIAATTGDVTLSNGTWVDVAGRERDFDGVPVAAPGGDVQLIADNGNVSTAAGSTIDVSAAGAGKAGSISVSAAAGSVSLAGGVNGRAEASSDSGRFSADAWDLGNFSVLNSTLNSGGFLSELDLRQRGVGDLIVAASDTVRAHEVSLTADRGGVSVNGVIDARGASGGDVTLSAQNTVDVSGSILASATSATGDGGHVALRAVTGATLAGGSLIDVSSGADADEVGGKVDIRVAREAVLSLTNGDATDDALALAGTIRGAERTTLEAFKVYDDASGIFTVPGVITAAMTRAQTGNVLYDDAVDFMTSESAILAALGRTGDTSFRLQAGIELQTAGDLTFQTAGTAWNLATWRFGAASAPGVLTLRAGGNLTINGSISDGFAAATGAVTNLNAYRLTQQSDSWSYRLIAGADQASADAMAVNTAAAVPGNFTITAPAGGSTPFHMVRTGNGSIEVAAAGDFELQSQKSVLYTAGTASPVGVSSGTGGLGGRTYPINGGDIAIDARGDIKGAQTNQLVTAWLWRTGKAPDEQGWSTAWTVNFGAFEQGIGALGGGDVNISAGGDITNLSASIPTIGRQMASNSSSDSRVEIVGGGDLDVEADGNIAGGSFYIGRGTGNLFAGGDVTTASFSSTVEFDAYPVLALGDGQWNVTARGSAGIETIVNPTLLPQGTANTFGAPGAASSSFFTTYTDDSAVNIRAVAGDVTLSNDTDLLASALTSMWNNTDEPSKAALRIQPPTLRVASLSGDVTLSGETTLYPASGGTVELLADGSVLKNEASPFVQFRQSDADPAALPTVQSPDPDLDLVAQVLGGINPQVKAQHASVPVHAGDDSLARIVARTGDVSFETTQNDNSSILSFATPARIVAAGDITDLPLSVQHDDANDITSLVAGGDIRYVTARSEEAGGLGGILRNSREITVDGPGLLQLAAGGEVDLQTSAGITTRGNVVNSNLPDGGASISVMAGASESEADYAALISRYFELDAGYETDLIGYVESVTGETDLTQQEAQTRFEQLTAYRSALIEYVEDKSGRDDLTLDGALALFRGYTRSEQRSLMERVAFSELRLSGRDAATSGSGDFTRGFTALETLFPGSNPDTEAGEANPYEGDISLYFSRIYSLDGGDISLLTPGGEVNVGLASPPASFGLVKGAAELGLVAQSTGSIRSLSYSDFAVEESRVFAADGGDILVWSTDGDIDAGRGAKTAISAPAPTITFDDSGRAIVNFPAALTGSGIQTLASSEDVKPGNVDLFAPRGVVNAGDAGIVAGNLTIAATAVLGADNIQVSGVSVGTQVDPGALAPSLANVSAAASSAANTATNSVDGGRDQDKQAASLGDTALSWLEVFVIGLGEDNCGQSDIECLKRQKVD